MLKNPVVGPLLPRSRLLVCLFGLLLTAPLARAQTTPDDDVDWGEDDDEDWNSRGRFGVAINSGPALTLPYNLEEAFGLEGFWRLGETDQITLLAFQSHAGTGKSTPDNVSSAALDRGAVLGWRHFIALWPNSALSVVGGLEFDRVQIAFNDLGNKPGSSSNFHYNANTAGLYGALATHWYLQSGLFIALNWLEIYRPVVTLHADQTSDNSVESEETAFKVQLLKLGLGYSF